MTGEFETLILDRVGTDGRVARVTLNRPEVLECDFSSFGIRAS